MDEVKEEIKICKQCSNPISKRGYYQKQIAGGITNWKRLEYLWRIKKYCNPNCSYNYHRGKTKKKASISKVVDSQLNFTAPVKVWKIQKNEVEEILVLLNGDWRKCKVGDIVE